MNEILFTDVIALLIGFPVMILIVILGLALMRALMMKCLIKDEMRAEEVFRK